MLMPWTHRVALQQREVAMRPARTITAVVFVAAIAVTGCAAHSAVQPSPAPSPPVVDQANLPVTDDPAPKPTPTPKVPIDRVPVLADGRYDSYIRRVEVPYEGGTSRLVVDLVQVFQGQAAVDAAIADGMSHDKAQVLGVYVRNHNPRLRTLPLTSDVRLDLRGGDCEAPTNHQLAKLMEDARAMSGPVHTYYFTLTVAGGAVDRVQEFLAINAC
jgi:hypothetical protein